MKDIIFLNISRSLAFQTFCSGISDALRSGNDIVPWEKALQFELSNLMRNRPIAWKRPVADVCYFSFLKELQALIKGGTSPEAVDSLKEKAQAVTRKKWHALFLTEEVSCWPSLEKLFSAAQSRLDCHATLVYTPFKNRNFIKQKDHFNEYVQNFHLPILRHTQYHLEEDSPDVVFMIKPYNSVPASYRPRSILSVIPHVVYIPYGMEITTDLIDYAFQHYLHYKAWRHCAYGQIVKDYAEKYGFRNGENVVVWGHPKADHYLTSASVSHKLQQFIQGRKTILWSPHHIVDLTKHGNGTWLLWGQQILELALQNTDIAFIFRPHPLMIGALVHGGFMSRRQISDMRRKIDESSNILWDDNGSYIETFHAADAIITDGTTFSIEFLYTKKPILLTPRDMDGFYACEEMMESYYVVKNIHDVESFIQMIREGRDPLREKRLAFHDKMFFIPQEKTVSENILDNVVHDLREDCEKEVRDYVAGI